MEGYNILEVLECIDPATLDYQEWCAVGMALKQEGYSSGDWETWSSRDALRYHKGECQKKWSGFHGTGMPVTGGTIVQLAKEQGWKPVKEQERSLEWDDTITVDGIVVDHNWVEGREVKEPVKWQPEQELIQYLETLFDSTENVGYVTTSFEKDGKFMPTRGNWDRTAGQLIEQLSKCNGDIGNVLGDYNAQVGAWIRFNPLDGNGVKNDNVTEFRYALVESDSMDLEKQNAIIRELELPVACLVHSGGKSLHAIVHIDAADYGEYRKRVDYLYDICKKNGLAIDQQNRNPSRLSRMPGIMRGEHKQFLAETNIGKESWTEWKEWIESINDDLPEPESLQEVWDDLPELAPCLINGILRQGHKMLIAGPSKAGKSFLLIEMCIAIAEGRKWMNWDCTCGKILYVNLELDRASCLHRFHDVYKAIGTPPRHLSNIDIWNLRGKSRPMDKLAPMLIRRAAKKNYIAIVIDPIYKVITGDENSADQMANFCNQFDKVCTELGVAVIYCHHHSKGSQSGKKSMDRASGSGVFARDPDALLDLIELETNEDLMKQETNKAVCLACKIYLDAHFKWQENLSLDDLCSSVQMLSYCKDKLDEWQMKELERQIELAKVEVQGMTAWRIEGTLREFPKFQPANLWFRYPTHTVDDTGVLKDIQPDAEQPPWKRAMDKRKSPDDKKKERKQSIETAYEACGIDEKVTVEELAEYLAVTEKTVRNHLKEHGGFVIEEGEVKKKT